MNMARPIIKLFEQTNARYRNMYKLNAVTMEKKYNITSFAITRAYDKQTNEGESLLPT